jgi:hypothetical protein
MVELNIDHNLNVDYNHGFFSCCSVRLHEIIKFFNLNKRLPLSVDSSKQFGHYKNNPKNTDENVSKFLFEDLPSKEIPFIKEIRYYHTYQYTPYKLLDFEGITPFIEKYFNLSQVVLDRIQFLEQKYDIDYENTAAVIYRGNDKITETELGSYSDFINKCREIHNANKNIRFLIQTDEVEFREEFISIFPNSIFLDELPAINKNTKAVVHNTVIPNERLNFALNFLSVIKIASKCEHLVTHSGNCGIWPVLFRGNTDNVHQLLLHLNGHETGWLNNDKARAKCVHVYLRKSKTEKSNMGFADFVRGTICLKQICDVNNYDFYIEKDSHDIFKFLEPNEKIVSTDYKKNEVFELSCRGQFFHSNDIFAINRFDSKKYLELYPDVKRGFLETPMRALIHYLTYGRMENRYLPLLKEGYSDSCVWISTNSAYRDIQNRSISWWGVLPEKDKIFIRNILKPSDQLKEKIKNIKENIYKTDDYKVIHIRTNDNYFNTPIDESFYNTVEKKVSTLLENTDYQNYVLMSNSKSVCEKITSKFPQIKYWENSKEHIGNYNDGSKIEDSIIDYFIMTEAKKIYAFVYHGYSQTGFSESIHTIFDVEYERL